MPERSPSITPSITTPTSGRRFFPRLTSPFASKSRNLTDFHISVDDPHKQYAPGDLVTGAVNLKIAKPTRVTHVVVCLHGFAQVYKNPGSPPVDGYRANGSHVGTGRGSKSGEYFGNGFASLFEDEVVLCGDGRLGEGAYQFRFNLEFPDRDLPSSISFERGTVSYMITATITRPTTISPTIQCDHKVYLVEKIDVSQLFPPKARTITLEAISRRSRAKTQAKKIADNVERKSRKDGSGTQNTSDRERHGSHSSSAPSSHPEVDGVPRSPAPSEVSFDSRLSSAGRPLQLESNATSPRQSDLERVSSSQASLTSRTITATVESLTGGVLRGDSIPVRVHVDHTKHIKSLHGVIITLYRQARVDLHPAIPLGPTERGKEAKYEDYYPKSVTGLGGLSLSGAGSSHMFRKDLSQSIVPLIVDPTSLTAEVTGRVHVPEEAFPTISTVPGGMISFKYFVEVVLDIQGKLSTQDRNLGNLGGLASTVVQGQSADPLGPSGMNTHGTPVIDTAAVRRDKGVVACTFEVVVGTRDSARKKGKRKVEVQEADRGAQQLVTPSQPDTQAGAAPIPHGDFNGEYWNYETNGSYGYSYDAQCYVQGPYTQMARAHSGYEGYLGHNGYHGVHSHHAYIPPAQTHLPGPSQPPIPIPQLEDEAQLSEKERIRRAEQRLLPSQPPDVEVSSASGSQQATAPYIPGETSNDYARPLSIPLPTLLTPPAYAPASAPADGTANPALSSSHAAHMIPLPTTPQFERDEHEDLISPSEVSAALSTTTAMNETDDKRELERLRLQQEASAPPPAPLGQEDDAVAGAESSSAAAVATAPPLSEAELYAHTGPDHHDAHADASAHPDLPRYER